MVAPDAAFWRALGRSRDNPVRRVHVDPPRDRDVSDFVRRRDTFDRVSVEAPWIEVDTTHGYQPGLDDIVSFINKSG